MSKPNAWNLVLVGLSALSLVGCENLPGSKGTQGAVIGGASGAVVGAAVGGEHNRALGAVLGGALGAAGGYVIGANSDKILGRDHHSAETAARNAQEHPATAQDALRAATADINNDGFVTMDEVVAMRDAGLSEAQILDRLRATGQIFELTPDQRQFLLSRGVSQYVVDQMEDINRSTRDRLLNTQPAATYPPPTTQYPGTIPSTTPYPSTGYPTTAPPSTLPPTTTLPAAVPPVGTPPVISQPPPSTIPPR
jgi:hypothetical protein